MARRRELKSIGHDFVHFLASRSFDIDGYWGVSCLYREAYDQGHSDLQLAPSEPAVRQDGLDRHFLRWLHAHMRARKLEISWLKQSYLSFHFDTDPKPLYHDGSSHKGPAFIIDLVIISDLGREYTSSVGGYCYRKGNTPIPIQRRLVAGRFVWKRGLEPA